MCERALKSPTYLKRREVKREERIPSPLVWYVSLVWLARVRSSFALLHSHVESIALLMVDLLSNIHSQLKMKWQAKPRQNETKFGYNF